MNWEAIGAIAELIGSLAVLGSLVYLGMQIKSSRLASAIETARASNADFREIMSDLSKDAELGDIVRRAVNDWESLNSMEQYRAHGVFLNVLILYLSITQLEKVPETKGLSASYGNNLLGLLNSPGGAAWFKVMRPQFEAAPASENLAFGQWVDNRFSDPTTLPAGWNESMPWWRSESAHDA